MIDTKIALVTGGSRGIGAAITRRLAKSGLTVAFTYASSAEQAAELAAETGAVAIQADSASPTSPGQAVEEVVRRFGRIDVLVNNAGVFPYGPIEDVTLEEIDRTLAIHVRAVLLAAQAAARHMGEDGRIISIGSTFAERVPYGGVTLYSASKAALVGLTKGLARDLGPRGIAVSLVQPGSTDTDMNPADSDGADLERSFTTLGRYCGPDDIAATVDFLAGPGGRNITGSTITVDAGSNA